MTEREMGLAGVTALAIVAIIVAPVPMLTRVAYIVLGLATAIVFAVPRKTIAALGVFVVLMGSAWISDWTQGPSGVARPWWEPFVMSTSAVSLWYCIIVYTKGRFANRNK